MKKNYKDNIRGIGYSDVASLTLRSPEGASVLKFGEDGEYKAYIIDKNTEVPKHYSLVYSCQHWIKIFDDEELTQSFKSKQINVYQAGSFGCIIQLIN